MKKIIFFVLIEFMVLFTYAQDLPNFDAIKLEKKEDYDSLANKAALQASNYIFSTPVEKDDLNRLKSFQYIIRWMTGTPEYSFTFDEQATKFAKNEELLGIYMAAMTKYVLENKEYSKDQNKIKFNAVKLVIAYAKDEKNKVKINSELKKAIEADAKGKLNEYLKI